MANKSHKASRKRIKLTGRNKMRYKRSGASHLMYSFTPKQRREHRQPAYVTGPERWRLAHLLGRGGKARKHT